MSGSIGRNVRDYRMGKDWTLRDLSAASGVSVSYLSELERGDGSRVSVGVLRGVAVGLGVAVIDLLDESQIYAWETCPRCGGRGGVRVDLRGRG